MLAGHELRLAEEELIEPATISTNRKAVLWLPASSPMLSGFQLAEIEAQIESLSDPCQERDEEEA
ncbi:MAG TPA: hypothetical protein VHM72_11545 [Solirubrobacteraceae bacterium]|nr:hypothetical protein [Solirubrobacteraceae bacterium]